MSKYRSTRRAVSDLITNIAEIVHMNHKLLVELALAIGGSRTTERKFRNAILIKLSNIEAIVSHIHGAKLAEMCRKDRANDELQQEFLREVEEQISTASERCGMKMIKYIYDDSESKPDHHDRRRRWWGWEI